MRGVIVYLGLALAGALFALGIRELRVNRQRKYGLFVSTVLLALYLLGARYAGAAESAKSVHETTLTQKDRRQIAELIKTKEWQNFKAFWKKLDEIVPNKNKVKDEKERSYLGEYSGAINVEERNELEKELKALISNLKKLEQKGIVYSLEVKILESICVERINYMSFGFRSMMMRMVPSPSLIAQEKSIGDLERNIDGLILLRRKGKVNKDEFRQALANVQGNIRAFSMLDTIGRHYVRFYNMDSLTSAGTAKRIYSITTVR